MLLRGRDLLLLQIEDLFYLVCNSEKRSVLEEKFVATLEDLVCYRIVLSGL